MRAFVRLRVRRRRQYQTTRLRHEALEDDQNPLSHWVCDCAGLQTTTHDTRRYSGRPVSNGLHPTDQYTTQSCSMLTTTTYPSMTTTNHHWHRRIVWQRQAMVATRNSDRSSRTRDYLATYTHESTDREASSMSEQTARPQYLRDTNTHDPFPPDTLMTTQLLLRYPAFQLNSSSHLIASQTL